MSHPHYNPYASGNQSSTQGQYGRSDKQAERDPQGQSSHHGPGSSFSSFQASSATAANSGRMHPPLLPRLMDYRPEQSRDIIDKNIERSVDMHISRAREEVSLLGKPMHQPIDQDTRFTSTQREELPPSGTRMPPYSMSSASDSLGQRHSGVERSSRSLDWLRNYERPTADEPSKFYSSSASSNYAGGGDGRFSTSSERQHDMQSIPGLGDLDPPSQNKPAAQSESSRPKYSSEVASDILQHFGLEKEDLEHLISYPEDQITPANLPYILWQIRNEKTKRETTTIHSKSSPEPQPTRNVSGMDSYSLTSSGGGRVHQKEQSSAVLQPSKVIDYGHTGKYTGGLGCEIGKSQSSRTDSDGIRSALLMDTDRRHDREPLNKNTTEVKSSALDSANDQMRSVSRFSALFRTILSSVAPSSSDQTQTNQTSQSIPSSFSLPKKDTDIRGLKSETSKPTFKPPKVDQQSTLKDQPSSTLKPVAHPSRHGFVVVDKNYASGPKDQSKTRGQGSVAEQIIKQPTQQQPLKKPTQQMQQQSKQQVQPTQKQPIQQKPLQPMQQTQKQSVSQTGQVMWPPVFSGIPPTSHIPGITNPMQQPVFIPGCPPPVALPPPLSQPALGLMDLVHLRLPSTNRQHPAMIPPVSKDLPTVTMMQDYAATTPDIFPHTCSLCNKQCTLMKDWISHQNSGLHLNNCKVLRNRYPAWDGQLTPSASVAAKDARPSPSTSSQTSQHRRQKVRHGSSSSSRSPSPHHRHGSGGKREKRRSRSRSPYSSRHRRRSRSPRYDRPTSSRYRSRSRSNERRSPPRRRDERRSSPKRIRDRRSSPRRGHERRSPPRWSDERRSGSRSSEEGRPPQLEQSSQAEGLAKKLLETSAVQSLSKKADLETVVKTLAPALLAELVKMKSSPSSSSSSSSSKKPSQAKPGLQKSEASASPKIKSAKSSPPTMVKLQGIQRCVSHGELTAAVEHFGKTKSVVVFRSSLEAVVCFEKEEDAKKLKSLKVLSVKDTTIIVVKEEDTFSKKPPQKKPTTSSASTPQTTTTSKDLTPNVPLPEDPSPSGDSTDTQVSVSKVNNKTAKQNTAMPKSKNTPVKGVAGKAAVKKKTSSAPENQPKESETKAQDPVPKDTAKVESKPELDEANDVKDAESMEIGEMGEPMKPGGSAEGQEQKPATAEVIQENPKDESSESQAPNSTVETKPAETSPFEPESTAQGAEIKTEDSHVQQQAAESPTEAAVEAKLSDGELKKETVQKDPVTAASKCKAVNQPTIGEMIGKHLYQSKIACLKRKTIMSAKFNSLRQKTQRQKLLLITNLPEYNDGCYTEEDLVELLLPFGFKHTEDSLYVVPQTRMAFVMMPRVEDVPATIKATLTFKGSKIGLHAIASGITMPPLGFYKSLMKLMGSPGVDQGVKIVIIKNISWSAAKELREAWNNVAPRPVKNYLPLLNQLFIEFESIRDADRFGVWYSGLKQPSCQELHRLNVLVGLKDCEPLQTGLPQGTTSPFWVPMKTRPFLFPTRCPWFIIPDFLTVRGEEDIEKVSGHGSMIPTIMLTGLPGSGSYKHEDVAELVWQYFPKQNLHSLYYNVVVLTLQRRAFVFFADWTTCSDFARNHLTSPVSVKGCKLSVHFVLDHMHPDTSEETMYTSLMKLNNAEMMYTTVMKCSDAVVPDPESLGDRLLCVEISETSLDIIKAVLELVASTATFVSFLPLANRIAVEMADSSDVTKVVERCNTLSWDSATKREAWHKVQHVETLKSLKQRLQDSSEIPIKFEPNPIGIKAKPQTVKSQTQPSDLLGDGSQPSLPTSGPGESTISEPITAGPSATASSDAVMNEDGEKPGTEATMDSTDDPEANEDVEKAEVKAEEGSLTTSISSPAPSATAPVPEENVEDVLQIDRDILQALTAAIRIHRLQKGSRSQSEEKESSSKSNTNSVTETAEDTPQMKDNFTDNIDSSDTSLFEEQHFNMDDFVTVDEVGDDVGDSKPESHSSSSEQSSKARSEKQSSDVSSTGKRMSTRSSKDSKSPASSSSKSSKGSSSSSSLSPKKSKDFSEPTKSSSKQPASHTASSGRSTRSSSAAHETQKIASAGTVEASVETHSELLKDKTKAKGSAVAKSDHKVSAEGITAKTVESELQPSAQGHELSQAQSLETAINDNKLRDQELREVKKDEKHQVLDSLDQIDEHVENVDRESSSKSQLIDPEEGHTLHEVKNEDKAQKKEYNETETDSSLQVLDNVTEKKVVTDQEEGCLVHDDGSTVKQLAEEDASSAGDQSNKDSVDKTNSLQMLDTGSEPVSNKDQDPDIKGTLKGPDSEVPQQDTFEVLDSIDDQTAIEDDGQNLETPSDLKSKEAVQPMEDEGDTFQVIDSVEDQPTTTETESETDKKGKRNIKEKDDRPSRRSGPTTRTSKSEEKDKSPKKQDRTAKKYETRTKKDKEVTEEMVYEIVDSVEEKRVQDVVISDMSGRRRSARGKTEAPGKPEEASFKILDSVEDETASDEQTITTRSTRGKKDASDEKMKKEEDPTSLKDEVKDKRPATRRKGQKGRPKKGVKSTKIESATLKKREDDASEKVSDEEAETYQIIDSVEDEMVGEQKNPKNKDQQTEKGSSPTRPPKKDEEEEEEPMYEILDSLEDDQAQEELAAKPDEAKDETPSKEEASVEKEDAPTCGTTMVEASKTVDLKKDTLHQIVDDLQDTNNPSAAEGSATGTKESAPTTDIKEGDKSTTNSQCDTAKLVKENNQQSPHKGETTSILVNLDAVSDEEEDYPDDTEEEEEQRKQQAAAKQKQLAKEQEVRRSREREERERRSRSRSSSRGQGGRVGTRRAKDRGREKEEMVEVDTKELVTLDEVGADEAEEEKAPGSREQDFQFMTEDLQALVTLDEFVEEEEGNAEQSRPETHPPRQEDESAAFLNPETLVTLDETGNDEEEKPEEEQTEKTSQSAKRKHDEDTVLEESLNSGTADKVDELEEEEPVKTKPRGRAKKRTRQTPVRKSTRGKNVTAKDEEKEEPEATGTDLLPPTPLDKDLSALSSDSQQDVQKTEAEVETANQADVSAASAGQEPQLEHPEDQKLEESMKKGEDNKEVSSRADNKVLSKQRRDPAGPQAKRSRSQSPCVPTAVRLPAFKPNNPLGQEFVVPKLGFFCNLCSLFYLNESSARERHCSSKKHYDNLQKHYQDLQQKPSTSCQGSVSD